MSPGKVAAAQATARSMASRALSGDEALAAAASSAPVQVRFSAYNPDPLTITEGDTVVWSFDDFGLTHTVTSVAGSAEVFDSGFRSAGTFEHTFTQAGTFSYYCILHGFDNGNGTADGMSGTIMVVAAPEPGVACAGVLLAAMGLVRRRK
jgi:plastocyanin